MGGLGFGSASTRRLVASHRTDAIAQISPSPAYAGTAGSGFSTIPTDPVRTTAKPALRLLEPPNQFYTDSLTVGVAAFANNGATMLDNLGIDRVRVHCEGRVVDIAAPYYRSFRDANGAVVSYLGWWVELRHDGRHGQVQVYFEAVPKDATMQSRVIGPFSYFPDSVVHDLELEVAATPAEIAGQRYRTIGAAGSFARQQGARNPRITITEAGRYAPTHVGAAHSVDGYLTIRASVPGAVIGASAPNANGENASVMRLLWDGVHFQGNQITLDFRYNYYLYHENPANRRHWLDGCQITNSSPDGRAALWRKGSRSVGTMIRNGAWMTEVTGDRLLNPATFAPLARGCRFSDGYGDVFSEADCVIGCRVTDWDSSQDWNVDRPALSVTYAGAEASATIELAGYNNQHARTLTARWGTNSASYTVRGTDAAFRANGGVGDNYHVWQLVDWINTTLAALDPGWSATLIDDSRAASALGLAGGLGGAFAAQDAIAAPLTLYTYFDVHSDFYQKQHTGLLKENVILADNLASGLVAQDLFFSGAGGMADAFAVNCRFENKEIATGAGRDTHIFSQANYNMSHVVIAHCSFARQGISLRTDSYAGFDSYCLLANCVLRSIAWGGDADGDLVISGNHDYSGLAAPQGDVTNSSGGSLEDLFDDLAGGTLGVGAMLRANPKVPILPFDALGLPRSVASPAGALA